MSTSEYAEPYDFEILRKRMVRRALLLHYNLQDALDIAMECVLMRMQRWKNNAKQTNAQLFTDACRYEGHIQRGEFTGKYLDRQAIVSTEALEMALSKLHYTHDYEAAIDLLREMQSEESPGNDAA